MDEQQLRELDDLLSTDDLAEEKFDPTAENESPSEIIEYVVAGLATGFLVVVVGFYLWHKYIVL